MLYARQSPLPVVQSARALFENLELEAVVCVDTGGRPLGRLLARELQLPLFALDIRYPGSRFLDRVPQRLVPLLWPAKELFYKFTVPRPSINVRLPNNLGAYRRLALVDDSASSGKTLQSALDILARAQIYRDRVTTIVGRCGKRAGHLVDVVLNVGA